MTDNAYDVVIIGGGVAGLTAGMYAGRAGLKTLVLERMMTGGQVINAEKIENYPGFPEGITGFELGPKLQKQATQAGDLHGDDAKFRSATKSAAVAQRARTNLRYVPQIALATIVSAVFRCRATV